MCVCFSYFIPVQTKQSNRKENCYSYWCSCPQKFTGTDCETETITACSSQPCLNGGTCNDYGYTNYYYCDCTNEFYDQNCTTRYEKPDPCETHACENGEKCQRYGKTYSWCLCPEGFNGSRCQMKQGQKCEDKPICQNGGTCAGDSYENWWCPPEYYGEACENELKNLCESNPCQNGASCDNNEFNFNYS